MSVVDLLLRNSGMPAVRTIGRRLGLFRRPVRTDMRTDKYTTPESPDGGPMGAGQAAAAAPTIADGEHECNASPLYDTAYAGWVEF